jgi:hypothetical protein
MADILTFQPEEYEVLEEFTFEEEIQRPDELRFFTLDEQLLDYFEKVLPVGKKISKADYKRISKEVDRIRTVYQQSVTVTDSDYRIDSARKELNIPWIKNIYSSSDLKSYSYAESWLPIFSKESRTIPNFFSRMVLALPKPYKTSSSGIPITQKTVMVDEEGKNEVIGLGQFSKTKTYIHEDGSMTIEKIPLLNTQDEIKSKGFYLSDRNIDIPHPLADHPFLSSNKPRSILTQKPLLEVFPTIEAILTHAVPVTKNPYQEGLKYLKIYDVKLSNIPWKLWKDKFPPEDTITADKKSESITFPKNSDSVNPSESLQKVYNISWNEAINPRFWLMHQEDRGQLVINMILSMAHESGLVPPELPGEKPKAEFPKSTAEDCLKTGSFEEFVESGIFDLKNKTCIPTSYFSQLSKELVSKDKKSWNENILKEHQQLLKDYQSHIEKPKKEKYDKYDSKDESDLRRDVKAILKDSDRLPEDKAYAIEKIIRNLATVNKVYIDKDSLFIICSHTMSELKGDLERDWRLFYDEWTYIDGGFRSCKFCGEQINSDVLVSQDDFDESGNPLISMDVLPTQEFHGHVTSFTSSLNELKHNFMLENPGESTFYLLLSLLQVLPKETQLLPIIQMIRDLSGILRKSAKIEKADKERVEGILGLAGMVILLQTHNPFLIPRRSFGSKILKLTGYPRDTDDTKDSPVLDILISIMKSTFELSPSTFKGPSKTLFKAVLVKPKEIRKESLKYIDAFVKKFKAQLIAAKERYDLTPLSQEITNLISFPTIKLSKNEYEPMERLGAEELSAECKIYLPRAFLSAKLPPKVSQEKVKLQDNIKPSKNSQKISSKLILEEEIELSKKEIEKNLSMGFPKLSKMDKIELFIKSTNDGIALLFLLNRILDFLSSTDFSKEKIIEYREISTNLKTSINLSILRDISKGLLYKLFNEISSHKNKISILNLISLVVQKDLSLNMMLLTEEEAQKEDLTLRAKERETFKMRMRQMDDTQREITKMLLDIGLAGYIITNEDRELFSQEYNIKEEEPNLEESEDGQVLPDYEDGDIRRGPDGRELTIGNGGYGEQGNENGDYNGGGQFDDGEGFGV